MDANGVHIGPKHIFPVSLNKPWIEGTMVWLASPSYMAGKTSATNYSAPTTKAKAKLFSTGYMYVHGYSCRMRENAEYQERI